MTPPWCEAWVGYADRLKWTKCPAEYGAEVRGR